MWYLGSWRYKTLDRFQQLGQVGCTGQDAGNAMVTAVIGGQWLPSQPWPQQADCCHQARKKLKNNLHGAQGERLKHRYK